MNNRRKFLKSAGSTALFTSLGSSFFIGCSTSEEVIEPDSNNNNNNNVSPDDGYSVDGGNYIIELNHSNFSILKTVSFLRQKIWTFIAIQHMLFHILVLESLCKSQTREYLMDLCGLEPWMLGIRDLLVQPGSEIC